MINLESRSMVHFKGTFLAYEIQFCQMHYLQDLSMI